MRFPNSLLIGLAIIVLWSASLVVAPPMPQKVEDVPALAIAGSAYGSLAARTMRVSLYSYWHGGEAYHAPEPVQESVQAPTANTPPPPPPSTPGVFSRRRLGIQPSADPPTPANHVAVAPPAPAPEPEIPQGPLLERASAWLNSLEKRRTQRQDNQPLSNKHRSYLNAATGVRLRLAYNLDPGDSILYEILHHHILTTSTDTPQALVRSQLLTNKALAHAHSSHAGMSDALTGQAAAINALDEMIAVAQPELPTKERLLANWKDVISCQSRFRELRGAAEREGWWSNIPKNRRMEIDKQAVFLDRLTKNTEIYLTKHGVEVSHQ
jgi:hypothetical protein